MNSKERRAYIEGELKKNNQPLKGNVLAEKLGVTRQIIVKDIAILRAAGVNIIATPEGYMTPNYEKEKFKKILALNHKPEDIENELKIIVKYGGIIEDVVIEHPLYGEIRAMLMIKNYYDIQNFLLKFKEFKAEPLLILTGGIHIHTIQTDNEDNMEKIINELREHKYLISD